MCVKPATDQIELDIGQVEETLDRIEEAMGEETVRPLRLLLTWCLSVCALIQEKNLTIDRLRRMVFGPRSEQTRDVLPDADDGQTPNGQQEGSDTEQPASEEQQGTNGDEPASEEQQDPPADPTPPDDGRRKQRRRPKKGHGRIPASAYTGCQPVIVRHGAHQPGDSCPHCQCGTLYRSSDWAMKIRLKGQPPIGGTRYELERLRCGLCGRVETAELPEEAGPSKYDATVTSIIATLRYGEGMPWTRIERIQRAAGIPVPMSVQWELVRDGLQHGPQAAYEHLLWMAAQGDLMHNDDTHMQVLDLTTRLKQGLPIREDAPHRTGVYTTNILSIAEGRPTISLFFTGPRHSGENLGRLLKQRMAELGPPLHMCDGLSHNLPGDVETIVANCLSHGRRKFVELVQIFADEVQYVLFRLRKVYRTDAAAKRFKLSPDQRLALHQRRSKPVMDELHKWFKEQLDQKKVEPNSSMGKAINYMLNRWDELTLFLHRPGVPLDNNLCEQAIKMAIRHRKNSLFYKTQRGADVGDIYMTLIYTCYLVGVDPFQYLTALQKNERQVKEDPASWLPWNYREQLDSS